MPSTRQKKVQELLVHEISDIVRREIRDPRVGFVTITDAEVSPDLRHARVFVSVFGPERKRQETLDGLAAAHGVRQARIAHELRLKRTPQLAFEYDRSVEEGVRMSKLIDELGSAGHPGDE